MYKGYLDVVPTEEQHVSVYQNPDINVFDCLTNQYVILRNEEGVITDKLKWTGKKYTSISYKPISNDYTGKIKPRNPQQELAFDMLQDKNTTVKVLSGGFGVGKTMLMVSTALQLIKDGYFDKLIWIRNNQEVKNSKPIGFLPGDYYTKLMYNAMCLADHVGGVDGLEYMIKQNKINLEHLGLIRGRDLKNAIVLCNEAENLTKQHVQLLIGRIAEGSNLWIDGDWRQTDAKVFEENNGLKIAIEKLKGHHLFAYVHLEKSERSETAAMADLLD